MLYLVKSKAMTDKDLLVIIAEMLRKQDQHTEILQKQGETLQKQNETLQRQSEILSDMNLTLKGFMQVSIKQFDEQQKFNERIIKKFDEQQAFNERLFEKVDRIEQIVAKSGT